MSLALGLILAAAIIFCALSVYHFWLANLAYASRRWPSVSGRFIFAGVWVSEDAEGPPTYSSSVHYRYEVGGKEFESSRIRFAGFDPRHQFDTNAEVASFGKGPVSVVYDPRCPSRSCLIPGPCRGMVLTPVVYLVLSMVLAGAYLFVPNEASLILHWLLDDH
ncbi:MAG: hypothetical protein JWO04_3541 [Gammaproteobacteria bacterium]|nr:hypothetical protein [Gammaproteobacteria bacterium]